MQFNLLAKEPMTYRVLQQGAVKFNEMESEFFDVKRQQLQTIKLILNYEQFLNNLRVFKNKIKIVQNRFAFADDLMLNRLMREVNAHKVYCMYGKKPSVKGGLEEVTNMGDIYKVHHRVYIDTNENRTKWTIEKMDIGHRYIRNLKVRISKDHICVDNKEYSLNQFISMATQYRSELKEYTFKTLLIANMNVESVLTEETLTYTIKLNGNFEIRTPFGITDVRNFFRSKVLKLLYLVYSYQTGYKRHPKIRKLRKLIPNRTNHRIKRRIKKTAPIVRA
jgi:hypothetical protein